MEKIIGYCGIICSECEAYLATKFDDDKAREKVAETWSKTYNADLKPEDINCNGCISKKEPLFGHCKVCEIRKCAIAKNNENCAFCETFPCEMLSKFFDMAPGTKDTLEQIRQNLT